VLDIWTRLEALGPVQYPAEAKAAVLVPVYRDEDGRVRVILTKRPDHMRTHPGDVVFPGGRLEDGEDPEATAKREACEEIGLPESGVDVIGGLSPVTTRDPGNLIVPVVAKVVRPSEFTLQQEEVASVIEPALVDLLDERRWRTSDWFGHDLWFYEFDQGIMWGATAFMMREFLDILRGKTHL
jgi:8-oxo-dGTP pyrophosphatase MutT (NUDIX family)